MTLLTTLPTSSSSSSVPLGGNGRLSGTDVKVIMTPVTTNLDPPFFVPPGPHISKYLDPPVRIFQKYMDPL